MIKKIFLPLLIVAFTTVLSQNIKYNKHQVYFLPTEPKFLTIQGGVKFLNNETTQSFLENNYLNSKYKGQSLMLEKVIHSPAGMHIRFKHIFNGLPVFQSFVQANYSKDGTLNSVMDDIAKFDKIDMPTGSASATFWANSTNGLTPAFLVTDWDSSTHMDKNRIYNLENELLLSFTTTLRFQGPDSMVTAMVYLPNPLVTANVKYGGKYIDNNDANTSELTAARSKVRVPLNYANGKFSLKNRFITNSNLSDPPYDPIQPTDTFLNYTRDQIGFEDINAYFHLYSFGKYISNLGFSALQDSLLFDTHALSGDDNSMFYPSLYPFQIHYGTGGVDDAEDGQVVIHEFGHLLSHKASPYTVLGEDRVSMEEGQADYLAMAYSRSLSMNKPDDVFSWDGHNEFYDGFTTNTRQLYTNRTGVKDIDRDMWSTALMCINEKIGRTKTDSLLLSYYINQATYLEMPQSARIILKMDSLLFKGKNVAKIWQCFTDRKILDTVPWNLVKIDPIHPESDIKFYSTYEFSQGISDMRITFKYPGLWKEIKIYDALGQIVQTIPIVSETILQSSSLKSGVYFLKIEANDGSQFITKKILR